MFIPKGVLELRHVAAREKTRYALNGMHLERDEKGRCTAVATDGKALAVATWSDASEREDSELCALSPVATKPGDGHGTAPGVTQTVIPLGPLDDMARALAKPSKPADILEAEGRALKIRARGYGLLEEPGLNGTAKLAHLAKDGSPVLSTTQTVEGCYPPFREAMPKADRENVVTIGLDIGLLATLAEALHAALGSAKGDLRCRLEISGPEQAVRVLPLKRGGARPDITVEGVLMPIQLA